MAKIKAAKFKINLNSPQLLDFLMEIMILVVVFIMPTIFDRRLGIVFSGTKTTWMRVMGSVILGIWAIKLVVFRQHRWIRTPLDWPVLSFLLGTTIATLTSIHVYTSFAGFYGRYEGLTSWYCFGIFFFVVTNYIKSLAQLKRIIMTVISAASLMSIYSLLQSYALDPYMWGGVVTWQRVIGMIGQPNFLAAYMLLAFFILMYMFLIEKKWDKKKIDWLEQLLPLAYFFLVPVVFLVMIYTLDAHHVWQWYLSFVVMTVAALSFAFSYEKLHPLILNLILLYGLFLAYICILYTQSRGGFLGLGTGLVLFVFLTGRHWFFRNWRKLAVLGILIFIITVVTNARPDYDPFGRFTSEISVQTEAAGEKTEKKLEFQGAAGSRGETWKSAFNIIADYPFFGIGPEVLKMVFPRYETELFRFKEAFHVKQDRCHNETFDVGVTKGLVTFFVYLWLLFVLFRVGFEKIRKSKGEEHLMLAGLMAAILAFLVQNQFSFGVVAITSLFWITWAMVMVVGEAGESEPKARGTERFSWLEIPWIPVALVVIIISCLIYVSFYSFRGDIRFKTGKTYMQLGRMQQAVDSLESSLKVFPFEGGTVSHLGIAYLNLSRNNPDRMKVINQAIAALKYGSRIDPYNADDFFMLSKIYLMLGDLNTAQKYSEIAIKIDPYYAEVFSTLALIYESQGKNEAAAANYEKSFLINPNLAEPMDRLIALNQKRGKARETIAVFERAEKKYSNNLTVLQKITELYLNYGRVKQALDLANRMIALDSGNAVGYILRGEIYLRTGEKQKAFSDFEQVLLADPKNVPARNGLGRTYLLLGRRDQAKKEFEQVLMLEPDNALAKEMLIRLR